ncbi:hypothetical protein FB451DRAFT_1374437 [Mycena latifolia]|nr:hypothetical protein FB451DRAFT_1374437 [Mycena latifolia]
MEIPGGMGSMGDRGSHPRHGFDALLVGMWAGRGLREEHPLWTFGEGGDPIRTSLPWCHGAFVRTYGPRGRSFSPGEQSYGRTAQSDNVHFWQAGSPIGVFLRPKVAWCRQIRRDTCRVHSTLTACGRDGKWNWLVGQRDLGHASGNRGNGDVGKKSRLATIAFSVPLKKSRCSRLGWSRSARHNGCWVVRVEISIRSFLQDDMVDLNNGPDTPDVGIPETPSHLHDPEAAADFHDVTTEAREGVWLNGHRVTIEDEEDNLDAAMYKDGDLDTEGEQAGPEGEEDFWGDEDQDVSGG